MTINFIPTTPTSVTRIWNSDMQTIIINTNCVGTFFGVGKEFLQHDAQAAQQYVAMCAAHEVHVGIPVLMQSTTHENQQYILCPIKVRSGDTPRYKALENCLRTICANATEWGIASIGTIKMGCGYERSYLNWNDEVLPLYQYWFANAPITINVYGVTPVVTPVVAVTTVAPVAIPAEKWQVYHFTNLQWMLDDMIRSESAEDAGYQHVATVAITPCTSVQRSLETLVSLTMTTGTTPWYNKNYCTNAVQQSRSIMSGDVFMNDETHESYRVGDRTTFVKLDVFAFALTTV